MDGAPNAPIVPVDWTAVRGEFPAVATAAYLDTATYGPAARRVLAAVQGALAGWSEGTGAWKDWEATAERSRGLFARWLGADAGSVALVSSLSQAAAQVAESLPPAPGANLVVGAGEFRSNLFPWMNQTRRGFEVRCVPFVDGRLDAGELAAAMDDRTALVAVSHVQSSNGHRVDLERVAAACRRHGARLFLDATQSLGALRVPVDEIDYLGTAAYKWLLAPRGAAFLYVKREHVAEIPPLAPSWKSVDEPYAAYYGPPFEPAPRASRLDASLAWPVWVGATAALELLTELGPEPVERRCLALAGAFREGLAPLGLRPSFDEAESSQIVGLKVGDADAVRDALAAEGVVAAVRDGYLRVSFCFFNDETDVERALRALAKAH